MLDSQTLSCLHEIPVVRSSTTKIQDVYTKAKDTSALIRMPCNLAETIVDRGLKVGLKIASPLIKPLSGPVHAIDNYTAETIRQIESKYPAINTPTENVVNTFNEKTKPAFNVMNSVKDTTTTTIQHGKDTVSQVAMATVNRASGVADSVYSFCETRVPKGQPQMTYKTAGLKDRLLSIVSSSFNYVSTKYQPMLVWFRILAVQCLFKTKQINDVVINHMQNKPVLMILPQRILILASTFMENIIGLIKPSDKVMKEWKKSPQESRAPTQSDNRQNVKPNLFASIRKYVPINEQEKEVTRTGEINNVSTTQQNYSNMTDAEELRVHSTSTDLHQSYDYVESSMYTTEPNARVLSNDIEQMHARLKPTDVELLYSRLNTNALPSLDNPEPLTEDQQSLHARIISNELEQQGYVEELNANEN